MVPMGLGFKAPYVCKGSLRDFSKGIGPLRLLFRGWGGVRGCWGFRFGMVRVCGFLIFLFE